MSTDDTNPEDSQPDVRAARRAQREAERAARAQRKADAARERAMEAARAGGLFEGMEAMPRGEATSPGTTPTPTPTQTPTSTSGPTPTTGSGEPGPERATTAEPMDPARRRRLMAILAVASVVLLVFSGIATWRYLEARDATAVEQQVASAPTQATDAAREIVTQMFTYDHRTVDAELAAVRERLTDPALTEFVDQSMPTVASAAKQQEASVYATVAAAAPQEVVDADNVTVLVMLNRMVSTKEAPEAASSASRLSLQMVRADGTWKLGELNAL
ncbi:MAG: hypothetical protein ACK4UY_03480 [Dietzia sp.]